MIRIWHTVPRCCRNSSAAVCLPADSMSQKLLKFKNRLPTSGFLLQIISRRIAFGKWLTHNADTSVPQHILRQLWFYQFQQCRVVA